MTLYCNGTGNPSPQTAWIKSGKVLVTDSAYVIRGIKRSQAGIYQCMAWNGIIRNMTSNCSIDVHCKLSLYAWLNVKLLPVFKHSFFI